MQKILKVKYCYSEEELNEFLATMPFEVFHDKEEEKSVSKLYGITYLPAPNGEATVDTGSYRTDIIAVVQYWEYK